MHLPAALLFFLAACLIAMVIILCRLGVVIRRARADLALLCGNLQDIMDQQIPSLFANIAAKEVVVPKLADRKIVNWLAEMVTVLEELETGIAGQRALAEQRWTDAEARERQAIDTVSQMRGTVEACRAGLWTFVGVRWPAFLMSIAGVRITIPTVPERGVTEWCQHADGLVRGGQAAAVEHHQQVLNHAAGLNEQLDRLTRAHDRLDAARVLREGELRHLVATRLPAVIKSAADSDVDEPGILHHQLAGTGFADLLDELLELVRTAERHAEIRADDRAKSVVQAVMRTVRSQVAELEVSISAMQREHDAPDVLASLLRIDHACSQLLRRSQAIAMVCGATSGTQRADASLSDVVRGAVSRIRDYPRIKVGAIADGVLLGHRVEQAVLAIAELLDNAARHSTGAPVHVSTQLAHHGMSIIIDDAGIGMSPDALEHANNLLTGTHPVRIRSLGDPPRIGLAACAVLVAAHGFRVNLAATSPYGGVRAVLYLPPELLAPTTRPRHGLTPASRSRQQGEPAAPPALPTTTTPHGLPIRPPRHVIAPAAPTADTPTPPRDPAEQKRSAGVLTAWQHSFHTDGNTLHERTTP